MASDTHRAVWDLLDACAKRGEAIPSHRTIRAKIGVGSFSTIAEAVQAWRRQRVPASTVTGGLGAQFMKTIEDAIWAEVRPLLQKAADDAKQETLEKTRIDREEAWKLVVTAEEMLSEAQSQEAKLKDALEAKASQAKQIDELQGEKEALEAKLKAVEAELQETQTQLRIARDQAVTAQKMLADEQANYIKKLEELAAKPARAPKKRNGAGKGKASASADKGIDKEQPSANDAKAAEKLEAK